MSAAIDTFAMLRRGCAPVDAVLYLPDGRTITGISAGRLASAPEASAPAAPSEAPGPAAPSASGEPEAPARAAPSEPGTVRPYLVCPECDRRGHPGRIGTQRRTCAACNRFAAAVRAEERRRAVASLPDAERRRHRFAAERAVYARHHPGRRPVTTPTTPEEGHR